MCRNFGGIIALLRAMKYQKKDVVLPNYDDSTFTNKDVLGQFDFKQVLQNYYWHIVHKNKLEQSFESLASFAPNYPHTTTVEILPYSVWALTGQYWNNHAEDITRLKKYLKDYCYVVDLNGDPKSAQSFVEVPSKIGGRLIYYKKNKKEFNALNPKFLMSRAEYDMRQLQRDIEEINTEREVV